MDDREKTEHQPRQGERVMSCGHRGIGLQFHWWAPCDLGTMELLAPDGSIVRVDWLCACERCFDAANGKPDKVPFSHMFAVTQAMLGDPRFTIRSEKDSEWRA